MGATTRAVAPRRILRRREFIGALIGVPCATSFTTSARGEMIARNLAQEFVAELGGKAFSALRNTMLSKRALEGEFRSIYRDYFDVEAITRWVAGKSWRAALSEGRDGRLRELIGEYVTKKLVVGLYDYRFATFSVRYSARYGSVEEVISEVKDEPRGRYLSLTWLLAVKGPSTFRVGDVKIGAFSFLINERGHLDRLFSSAGNTVEGLLHALGRLITELDTMKLGG